MCINDILESVCDFLCSISLEWFCEELSREDVLDNEYILEGPVWLTDHVNRVGSPASIRSCTSNIAWVLHSRGVELSCSRVINHIVDGIVREWYTSLLEDNLELP